MLEDCRGANGGGAVRTGRSLRVHPGVGDTGDDVPPIDVDGRRSARCDDRHVHAWPDAQLVDAVRGEPVDGAALDALVSRYWSVLHARCELLMLDREQARDLAQETWLRVLRARRSLDPHASFAGFLVTIATNLCRDRYRSARRAGPLADARVASLDEGGAGGEDEPILSNVIAHPDRLPPDEQLLLRIDLDRALSRLTPRAREVLLARYVDGDSAAEIGARFGRTEQTITSWLRSALRELRAAFLTSVDR